MVEEELGKRHFTEDAEIEGCKGVAYVGNYS